MDVLAGREEAAQGRRETMMLNVVGGYDGVLRNRPICLGLFFLAFQMLSAQR